ncbi:MAG: DUF3006 domain-containing protein [Blastocatellales bacterium]
MTDDRQNSIRLNAYIDRIENDLAVIVLDNEDSVQFDLPLDCLPPKAKAGEHLVIHIKLDLQGKEASQKRIAKLLDELRHGADSDATGFKI